MTGPVQLDEDAMIAAFDMIGRTGARNVEFGYLHDDVPVHLADWYAHAQYQGSRIIVEHHVGPLEAVEALARRLLTGGRCTHCGGLVALSDTGAVAYVSDVPGATGSFVDGTTWTAAQARAAGQCRYRRVGNRWVRGCEGRERPAGRGAKKAKRRKRR